MSSFVQCLAEHAVTAATTFLTHISSCCCPVRFSLGKSLLLHVACKMYNARLRIRESQRPFGLQASRKVRPFLEQTAAAAAAAADAQGTAKAQAAAKKAKKLTPEEMKKMRQHADPNYQAKQEPAGNAAQPASLPKKAKKGKAAAQKAEAPDEESVEEAAEATATASAASRAGAHPNANTKPAAAATAIHAAAQEAAQAQADSGAGSKRRHGLGFAAEQPQSKRAKQTPLDPAAQGNPNPTQQPHTDPSSEQQLPDKPAAGLEFKSAAGLQSKSVTGQASASRGVTDHNQQRSGAAAATGAASQGPPVVFTDECTAFVRGMDHKVTEAEVKELLAPCGEVKDVRMVMDKVSGRPKVSVSLYQTLHTAIQSLTFSIMLVISMRHLCGQTCGP